MKKYLPLFVIFICNISLGQVQFIDTTFGTDNGYSLGGPDINSVAQIQILEYEGFYYGLQYHSQNGHLIAKTNSDGILEPAFGNNGHVALGTVGFDIFLKPKNKLILSADQKLLAVSNAHGEGHPLEQRSLVTKLNLDGTLDLNYGTGGRFYSSLTHGIEPLTVVKAADESLTIIGYNIGYDSNNPLQYIIAIKVDALGNIVPSFGSNGVLELLFDHSNFWPRSIAISNQDAYVLFSNNNTSGGYMAKIDLLAGEYNSNFGINGMIEYNGQVNQEPQNCMVDSSQNIFIGGVRQITGNNGFELYLDKFDSNGVPDAQFGINGTITYNFYEGEMASTMIFSLRENEDKIMIMGTVYNWDSAPYQRTFFKRLNLNGSPDTQFGVDGVIVNPLFSSDNYSYDYVETNDALVTCGSCPNFPSWQYACLVKYLKEGNLDTIDVRQSEIAILPNPVVNILTFKTDKIISDVSIFDISGRLVFAAKSIQNDLDISILSPGSYILKCFFSDGQTYTSKIVKQ